MKLEIPELSLVVLIGPSGTGKSTLAKRIFKPTEVLSSDACRAMVADNENDMTANQTAFEVLHYIAEKRLSIGKLTVIDATNVQADARKPLIALAREQDCLPVAIVLKLPEKICWERTRIRPDRDFPRHVLKRQFSQFRRSLRYLKKEGFRHVYTLETQEEIDSATIVRRPLWNNLKHEHGPFDIIGDVHGCYDELITLLGKLGYGVATKEHATTGSEIQVKPPKGRRTIFLGDLVDRGPDSPGTLLLVMKMVKDGAALCIPGNHDVKLVRKLRGRDVQLTHGLAETLQQMENGEISTDDAIEFLDGLISHYVLDDGKLVVAHAGLTERLQGRASRRVREFALYGETTGETDEFGIPVRHNWANDYRGQAMVVYGHTPTPEPEWINRTINIDSGCVFGGRLTALRYPEKKLVSVTAKRTYYEPEKPFLPEEEEGAKHLGGREYEDLLDIEDVLGRRYVHTGLRGRITIREGNAGAALEVMSRFASDPRWLIYLPPTMSPCSTSKRPGLLEHPEDAFGYYHHQGVNKVVCEEKHMGSRAIVIVCKDDETAQHRFGVPEEKAGICYTRTGRPFFQDNDVEAKFLQGMRLAIEKANLWKTLKTDWICLDTEIMPWSAKAQELLQEQYAAVGAAARASLDETVPVLERAMKRGLSVEGVLEQYRERSGMIDQYISAYRPYCWAVKSLSDFKLAPFHLLASEGVVHVDKNHLWHMESLENLCSHNKDLLLPTSYKVVDLTDTSSQDEAIEWWENLIEQGGEGMVVKPLDFVAKGRSGLVQPALKCRGRDYLRIIYGPEYTAAQNLDRLRSRRLSAKRSLALREFALGIQALRHFVKKEPLYRIHECVFGVLALESEPVDPRL